MAIAPSRRSTHYSIAVLLLLAGCGGEQHPGGGNAGSSGANGGATLAGSSGAAADPDMPGDGAGAPAGGTNAGAGSGAEPGAGAGGDDEGGASGSAGAAGSAPVATCSETPIRTGAPAGKEMYRTEPIDERFPFSSHWMGVFSDDPRFVSMTSFADLDHDGDLDFASGQREDVGGGMMWWEYCGADHWVQHEVGTGHRSAAGGNAADVNGDGWVDLIAGDSWYENPKTPRTSSWQRFSIGAPRAEELIVGEVTGDERPDVLYVWNQIQPQYWSPGADPTAPWTKGPDLANRQQQGGAIGDLDGDGDNDLLVGYRWWYRNAEGDGSSWETVEIFNATAFDNAPLTTIGDLDGDGDEDLIFCTHFGGRVAWAENQDGLGTQFELRMISTDKAYLHALVAADFDNDGDLDIFAGQNVGPSWMFENTDGEGAFMEHRIVADSRAHEARVGDVDCDGDLDIAGKPWGQQDEGGEDVRPAPSRDHVYLKNELVERGGRAVFERKPNEILPATALRVCPR